MIRVSLALSLILSLAACATAALPTRPNDREWNSLLEHRGGPDGRVEDCHRGAFERLPERTREVLGRICFTVSAVSAMDRAVNLDGLDPLTAARRWMDRHPAEVAPWFA